MTHLGLLTLSLAALLAAPFLGMAAETLRIRLSGALLVALVALVLLQVLPEAWESLGPLSLLVCALGWGLPTAAERYRHSAEVHAVPRTLVAAGLAGHALLDGAALGAPTSHALGWAVVLHRIPAATATWMVLAPTWGRGPTAGVLGLTGVATVAGFLAAAAVEPLHEGTAVAVLSALVSGSLLHLATHQQPHDHDHDHDGIAHP